MVAKIANLVQQATTSNGTGDLILNAVNGRQSFNSAFGNGVTLNVFYYFIAHQTLVEWEIGTGHLSDSVTLVRDTVIASSNLNLAVNFSAGAKDIVNDLPASLQTQLETLIADLALKAPLISPVFTTPNIGVAATTRLNFNTVTVRPTWAAGQMYYDSTEQSLAFDTDISGVNCHIGKELILKVKNNTAAILTKEQVVYVSGAQGNMPTAALAKADTSLTSDTTIGIVLANIAVGGFGYIITSGIFEGFNTAAFLDGDPLFVSDITAGLVTKTKPVAPNHSVRLGYALNSTNNGKIYVEIVNGFQSTDLHDIDATAADATGKTLIWDNTLKKYVAGFIQPQTGMSFYLSGTASDIATYKKMLSTTYTPKTTLSTAGVINNQILGNWATDIGIPNVSFLPAGEFELHLHAAKTAGTQVAKVYGELWEVDAAGVDIALVTTTESSAALGATETENRLFYRNPNPHTMTNSSSRLVMRIKANISGAGTAPTIALYYGDASDSFVLTPTPLSTANVYVNNSLTVTGTNWTTTRAVGQAYTPNGADWWMRFSIRGTLSIAAASNTIAISGTVAKNIANFNQAVTAFLTETGVADRAAITKKISPNTGTISIAATGGNYNEISITGEIELDAKPSWV